MLDFKEIIRDSDKMRQNLKARRLSLDLDALLKQYHMCKTQKQMLEKLQEQSHLIAEKVQAAKEQSLKTEWILEGKKIKQELELQKENWKHLQADFEGSANELPNWTAPDVPFGLDESANQEMYRVGAIPHWDFKPKDHLELGSTLGLIDFDAGAKVAGSKFYFLKNKAVLLQQALKQFAFRIAMEYGFHCLHTPDVARNHILKGIGFSPRGQESNVYNIEDTDLSLIATAEITVGGMHSEDIFSQADLPILYVAESHCFRKESGAAGQASKGLYRVHQFEKVELFALCTPEQSEEIQQRILQVEEAIFQALGIPYRVLKMCTGELGRPAYRKYDIEAWMPGKGLNGEFGEVTSASHCTDYQARRLNIRFKDKETGKLCYVHTLNGTALALSRALVAIFENFQTKEGRIRIPTCLQGSLGFDLI